MIPFEEADILMQEIIDFLMECGGVYEKYGQNNMGLLQEIILMLIATDQHIVKRAEDGKINHWLGYFKVHPEAVEGLCNNQRPSDIQTGSILYVAEHGNTTGRHGMTEIIRDLKAIARRDGLHGVFWNSKGRGMRLFLRKGA